MRGRRLTRHGQRIRRTNGVFSTDRKTLMKDDAIFFINQELGRIGRENTPYRRLLLSMREEAERL